MINRRYMDPSRVLEFLFFFLILASLGLGCSIQAFSSCGRQGVFSSCGMPEGGQGEAREILVP